MELRSSVEPEVEAWLTLGKLLQAAPVEHQSLAALILVGPVLVEMEEIAPLLLEAFQVRAAVQEGLWMLIIFPRQPLVKPARLALAEPADLAAMGPKREFREPTAR